MDRIIAVDFDGTCATHEYPRVGDDVPHTVEVLKRAVAQSVWKSDWLRRE